MAIIDLVQWSPQGNRTIYAWKFPETNLSTYTQLIVQESQEAILFSKGQIVGKFGPGKHTLNTENLPILRFYTDCHSEGRTRLLPKYGSSINCNHTISTGLSIE